MIARLHRRKGMSLLEVIIALAIFVMSVTGLVALMGVASNSVLEAQMRSQALSICQSRLAEVSCGALPLSGSGMTTCDDDDDYQWSMDVSPGSFDSLSQVTVTVSRKRANGTHLECSISQLILDPTVVGTVFDGAIALQTPSTSGSSTDPSSSSTPASASSGASASPTMSSPAASAMPKTSGTTSSPTTTPKTGGTTAPTSGSRKGS